MTTYFPDIPLKQKLETFYDDPVALEDVSLEELVFDLKHGIKDAGKLHLYHAVFVMQQTLEHIVRLRTQPLLFEKFRLEQLNKYNIEKADLDLPLSPASTPEITPDVTPEVASLTGLNTDYKEASPETEEEDTEAVYIPLEVLVANTSLDVKLVPQANILRVDLCQPTTQNSHLLKSFNLMKPPKLLVSEFLQRIEQYSPAISISAYVHASLMMFKLCVLLDVVPLTPHNVHRFILSSIRCCTKNLDDVYQKQRLFSTVVGVLQKDLYKLEVGFLYLCNFKLVVDEEMLNLFLKGLFVDLVGFCEVNDLSEATAQVSE